MRALHASSLMAAMGAGFLFACAVPVRPKAETKVAACAETPSVEIFFAPGPDCRLAAIRVIDGAKSKVRLSAYTLSSPGILAALKAAHARGVDVQLLLDRVNENKSAVEMSGDGIKVFEDKAHPINHEKMVTADGVVTWSGSANVSPSSEKDHELCTVIRDASLAAKVEADWAKHSAHSEIP